jgi:hypothetical protein
MKNWGNISDISAIVGSAARKIAWKDAKIKYYTFNSTSGNKYTS